MRISDWSSDVCSSDLPSSSGTSRACTDGCAATARRCRTRRCRRRAEQGGRGATDAFYLLDAHLHGRHRTAVPVPITTRSLLSATGLLLLDRRTRHRAVRAEHATIAVLGPQYRAAAWTIVTTLQ